MAVSINKPAAKAAPAAAKAQEATATAKAEAKTSVEAEGIQIDPEILGSLSDALAYVGVIVDPTQKEDKNDGSKGFVVVGYRFKVLRDLPKIVPMFGLDPNAKDVVKSMMKPGNFVSAKAGDELFLTRPETGALVGNPLFNFLVNGVTPEGEGMTVSLSAFGSRSASAVDGATAIPTFVLNPKTGTKGQTSYINPVDAFNSVKDSRANGAVRYIRTPILEGPLAKFSPLAQKRTSSVASTKPAAEKTYNPKYAGFLQSVGVQF